MTLQKEYWEEEMQAKKLGGTMYCYPDKTTDRIFYSYKKDMVGKIDFDDPHLICRNIDLSLDFMFGNKKQNGGM